MNFLVHFANVVAHLRIALVLCLTAIVPSLNAGPKPRCGLFQIPTHRAEARLRGQAVLPPADQQEELTVIEVMFLYTPEALIGAGEESALKRRLQQAMDEANYVYTNSGVHIQLKPVYIGSINYAESGDISEDLTLMANALGAFSDIYSLRNEYKADVVCLITERENAGIGGLAFDIPPMQGNSETAYLAVRRIALGDITLAHEIGHLMGCAHDREHLGADINDPFFQSLRSYIYGYRLQVEGVTYIDVMAYDPGVSLPYFANPQIQLDGVPLGVPEGGALPSDTARTINETAPYVSGYRHASSRMEFSVAETNALRSDGAIAVMLRRTGEDLSASTRVNVVFLGDSTAKLGVDYLVPISQAVPFQVGEAEKTFTIPVLSTGSSPSVSLHLGLAAPRGSHGIGLQRDMKVQIYAQTPVASLTNSTVQENAGTIEITPKFGGPAGTELPKAHWRVAPGTATAINDYVDASGDLEFELKDGIAAWKPIQIKIVDDSAAEPDETFSVIIEGTTFNGVQYMSVTNDVRITDNDRPGALLASPGSGLNPDAGFSLAVRADHKMLIWGAFEELSGERRTGIAQVNADGTLDPSFRPPELLAGHRRIEHGTSAYISNVRFLAAGKYLIAGQFARADGKPRSTIARLNSDGTLDESFGPNLRFDGAVAAVAVQPDGKILVGGGFEKISGETRSFIARLNSDGSIDPSFKPNPGPTSSWIVYIEALALQSDGKILIGGFFERVDGVDLPSIARLNSDGTLDRTFRLSGASGPVWNILCQSDGRIVVGGLFDEIGGVAASKLARLLPDGSVDASFKAPQPNADVVYMFALPDSRLLVEGPFTQIGGADRRFVAMLASDGSLDPDFDIGKGPDERPGGLSVHADGTAYLPGIFRKINSIPARGIASIKVGPMATTLSQTVSASGLTARAAALPGAAYGIQSSLDLQTWQPLQTVKSEGFGSEVEVVLSADREHRFLRIKNANP